ncbi:hypothetical protein F5Y17DRAFT_334203 [Xylariaceae sp. FL0594]|nr:hypothetical protein F5Y17DRAFT_334203 [Xylariaceae sp. FL0594]
MGRQGPSPPPKHHHHLPHHRHRQHRHSHLDRPLDSRTVDNNIECPVSLSLESLNETSYSPSAHAIVESWLRQVHPSRAEEPGESRGDYSPECHRDRPQNHRSWRPQHIHSVTDCSSPGLPVTKDYRRNAKKLKRKSHDSSLIDEYVPPQQRWENGAEGVPREREGRLCSQSPYEVAADSATDDSLPVSDAGEGLVFEKRPRHKTRADKYEKKESARDGKRRKTEEGKNLRKPRAKKKKDIAVGKNVMNNFVSEAVTNDRITVHPNLRPGLFKNKRIPTQHPSK